MQTTELYVDGALVAPHSGGGLEAINLVTETVIGRGPGAAGFMGFREIKEITRYDHTRTWGGI